MSDFTIRSLYPEDLDQVSNIESSLTGRPRRMFLEKLLTVATVMPDSFITTAVIGDKKLLGYGFARVLEGEFGARGATVELDTIGVDPACQGKGIGKMVMAGIEQRMKKKNINTLLTQVVWSDHSMIRFFAARGFSLASGQLIERDTSPLEEGGQVAADGTWRLHGGAGGDYYDKLVKGRVMVRPLKEEDLAAVDRIDVKLTGLDRSAYYASKFREVLDESGIPVSMVAEDDGIVTGFIIARADFGEFGKVEKTAVLDSIGVHPAYGASGVGHALLAQLLTNLSALQVGFVRTKVEHENSGLRNFLARRGFKPSQRLLLTRKIQ